MSVSSRSTVIVAVATAVLVTLWVQRGTVDLVVRRMRADHTAHLFAEAVWARDTLGIARTLRRQSAQPILCAMGQTPPGYWQRPEQGRAITRAADDASTEWVYRVYGRPMGADTTPLAVDVVISRRQPNAIHAFQLVRGRSGGPSSDVHC